MMKRLSLPLFLLSAVACGGAPEVSDAELGTDVDALNTQCVSTHAWSFRSAGISGIRLQPGSTHVCVLGSVSGRFEGAGERARVYVNDLGDWWLEGSSQQGGVSASAYCVRKSCFTTAGVERWNSPEFAATEYGSRCDAAYVSAYAWWGDAATFLTGVSGKFVGARESVEVWQTSAPRSPSTLAVNSCQPAPVTGWARSFFAGDPNAAVPARFRGPAGVGSSYAAGEYAAYSTGGAVEMAPTAQALCYLTKVGGGFRSASDQVRIYPAINANGVEIWKLSAASTSSDGVQARARCYLYDQRVLVQINP